MIVFCEQCGKKYELDPSQIRGQNVEANCTSCNGKIKIQKSDSELLDLEASSGAVAEPSNTTLKFEKKRKAKKKSAVSSESKKRALGLRTKILLLFFLVPIVLIVSAGYLFLGQLNNLSTIISTENTKVVTDIAESIISQKAYSVARQIKLYLDTHPELSKLEFGENPEFMAIAVQKVGEKGYTVINEAPINGEPWRIRAHPKKALIGADVVGSVKEKLNAADHKVFKKIHDDAHNTNKEVKGYYRWLDGKEKYLSMVPIEGTNLWTLSTTYIDEFTQPMVSLQAKAQNITRTTEQYVVIIISATALLVALIAIIYGSKLSGKIRKLKNIADSISVGDMDIEIDIKDKDELGDLAQAISRMQDSIRLSIERLRRRRSQRAA
jgi:HAMP domain-containing protein